MKTVKRMYLSENTPSSLKTYLVQRGYRLTLITANHVTYPAVCTHADIFCCRLGAGESAPVFVGNTNEIGFRYPDNVCFNAVCLDRYFIHNLHHTSPALLEQVKSMGLEPIHVNQGYTKCNCVVVDGRSLITADEGILRTLRKYPDIDVLPVRQGFVKLSGFAYGFLGGASGRVENEIIFNGDLSCHPDFETISAFIHERGLSVKYFPAYELEDIGSLIGE